MDFDTKNIDSYLKIYYQHAYPCNLIMRWLTNPNEPNSLSNREFALIMKDDLHLRFLSFNNAEEFKEKLLKYLPYKIDIGAVYNRSPRDRKKIGDFFPCERELIFDIDLTDYDSIRTCCKDAIICNKCWRFITIAVKVLENLLHNHFGFKYLLWVFSGRRGIHCWVADRKALSLNNRAREAIAKYLIFDKKSSVISKSRVHPMAEHSYREIMKTGEFDKLVLEQGWLNNREQWECILKLCADVETKEKLYKEFESLSTPELRWESLKKRYDPDERKKSLLNNEILPEPNETDKNFLRLFVLEYAHPRLDEKVTTGLNHLLKAPFTVHPKTGNIAVPLNSMTIAHLNLNELPRVDKLIMEIESLQTGENNIIEDGKENVCTEFISRTKLTQYIEIFEEFIKKFQQQ